MRSAKQEMFGWLAAAIAGCAAPSPPAADVAEAEANNGGHDANDAGTPESVACHPEPTIDGQLTHYDDKFGCHEFHGTQPVAGVYGRFHMHAAGEATLHIHNDWYLRDDAPVCAPMYNLFQFSTGNGTEHWQVRVYGDQHLDVLRNGKAVALGQSGAYFGPSPFASKPHSQFEFLLPNLALGELLMKLSDPANAASLVGKVEELTPGCSKDALAALVEEPTVLRATLTSKGMSLPEPVTAPVAVMLDPGQAKGGQMVTVVGAKFGTVAGTLVGNGEAVQVAQWLPSAIRFAVPETWAGDVQVAVLPADGSKPKPLTLHLDPKATTCPPSKNPCVVVQMGADGCESFNKTNSPCDDGDPCTSGDHCQIGGKCDGVPKNCDDGDACTYDTCGVGATCAHTKVSAGQPCSDNNNCTKNDTCAAGGQCVGEPVVCTGSNPCAATACDLDKGCISKPIKSGLPCDDGDACTTGDLCNNGSCFGKPVICPAGVTCNPALCPGSGAAALCGPCK